VVSREGNSLMYQLLIHSLIDRAVTEDAEATTWFCVLFEPIIQHIVFSCEVRMANKSLELCIINSAIVCICYLH